MTSSRGDAPDLTAGLRLRLARATGEGGAVAALLALVLVGLTLTGLASAAA